MTPSLNKSLLLLDIEERFRTLFPNVPHDARGMCLYWAAAAYQALSVRGYDALLQAGSLNWPIIPPWLDDGVGATHFSFEFEPHTVMSQFLMSNGQLPEMHVWVKLRATDEIIDLTTGFLQEQSRRLTSLPWLTDEPPPYLWSRELPSGVHYRPNAGAIQYAWSLIRRLGVEMPPAQILPLADQFPAMPGMPL